jgi:hypothetical protein
MDTDGRFPTPTTRRTIVVTGAKLAYAAPLVAASIKVSEVNAQSAVSPTCSLVCSTLGLSCGPTQFNFCICSRQIPSQQVVCTSFEGDCDFPCDATTGAGCPAGTICVDDQICGFTHCHPLCTCDFDAAQSTRASRHKRE